MEALEPFEEKRSPDRLKDTPLRRRHHVSSNAAAQERRAQQHGQLGIAATLEQNLDRFPTQAGMSTFLASLIYAAEQTETGMWRARHIAALKRAQIVLRTMADPVEAIATLQGYERFMTQRTAHHE